MIVVPLWSSSVTDEPGLAAGELDEALERVEQPIGRGLVAWAWTTMPPPRVSPVFVSDDDAVVAPPAGHGVEAAEDRERLVELLDASFVAGSAGELVPSRFRAAPTSWPSARTTCPRGRGPAAWLVSCSAS